MTVFASRFAFRCRGLRRSYPLLRSSWVGAAQAATTPLQDRGQNICHGDRYAASAMPTTNPHHP
ncbi:hypothetical protein LA76x_3219 [Lysobacter antibioticus]|uniref:Uncharacterized protein n=1 Tax=Lysobacter antibioticus TaxID=84531 RepID=A0A0S2FCQ2_LYSAN|nr:hypothetical protein LA76x_3219 [Lysobacter antibioticus]